MVGTDRSKTADQAVLWAAQFADRYGADLFVVQVILPQHPSRTEFGAAEHTRAAAANQELADFVRQLVGERGHACVVMDNDPALAIAWPITAPILSAKDQAYKCLADMTAELPRYPAR